MSGKFHNIQPKVTLLDTSGFHNACVAATNCVSSDDIVTIDNSVFNRSSEFKERLLKNVIIDNGHLSIAEFINFTFALEGINLACSHQWVRHRVQSIAQRSQRYVTHNELVTALPFNMSGDQRIHALFERSYDLYNELVTDGMKPEDARLVLPQAIATSIVCSLNGRELIHIIEERECTCAQAQICQVTKQAHELVKDSYGFIFNHVGPKCYRLGRCPEKRNSKGCQLYKKSPYFQ